MCSDRITSLGTGKDLKELKKEGVGTYKALVLHKCALAQSQLAMLTSCNAH